MEPRYHLLDGPDDQSVGHDNCVGRCAHVGSPRERDPLSDALRASGFGSDNDTEQYGVVGLADRLSINHRSINCGTCAQVLLSRTSLGRGLALS